MTKVGKCYGREMAVYEIYCRFGYPEEKEYTGMERPLIVQYNDVYGKSAQEFADYFDFKLVNTSDSIDWTLGPPPYEEGMDFDEWSDAVSIFNCPSACLYTS